MTESTGSKRVFNPKGPFESVLDSPSSLLVRVRERKLRPETDDDVFCLFNSSIGFAPASAGIGCGYVKKPDHRLLNKNGRDDSGH